MTRIRLLILLTTFSFCGRSIAQCSDVSLLVSSSDTTYVQLYHPALFLIPSGDANICYWTVTTFSGELVHSDTTSGDFEAQSFSYFDHSVPVTDSMKVTLIIENPVEDITCAINDTLFWEETEVIPGVFFGSWAILSDNGGVEGAAYSVTFQVDMSEVSDPFTTPEVNGTFNDWCGGCAPMTDDDADNIWQITIDLEAGFYEYKYAADTWTIQESLTPGDPCTMTTDIFTNRTLDVSEDMVLEAVCWGSCEACETETTVYSVTFMVNMNEVSEDFTTPEVNGTFNDWCGGCAPMTDDDADNIWQITIDLEEGSYEYKFAADTWTIQESLTPGDPCTVTADIFTNRQLDVFEDIVLNAVCWGSCEACDTTGGPTSSSLFELNDQVQLSPSVVDDGFVLSGLTQTYSFSITDLNGRLMDRYRNVPAGQKIMTDTYAPGLYILILTSETGEVIAMKKFFKE